MNIKPLKIFVLILATLFLSSCAVFVRDDHHHRRYRHHWRSSLQQSEAQMTAQNSGDSLGHE
jgi:outer membrane biogenesis lipoprotein LolB